MNIDEYITRFTAAAEFERTHGNLQGCLEFRQLVEWLKELKENKDVLDKIRAEIEQMNEDALNLLIPFDSIDNANYTRGFIDGLGSALDCIDKYRNEVSK